MPKNHFVYYFNRAPTFISNNVYLSLEEGTEFFPNPDEVDNFWWTGLDYFFQDFGDLLYSKTTINTFNERYLAQFTQKTDLIHSEKLKMHKFSFEKYALRMPNGKPLWGITLMVLSSMVEFMNRDLGCMKTQKYGEQLTRAVQRYIISCPTNDLLDKEIRMFLQRKFNSFRV